jgi:hypothetical protein
MFKICSKIAKRVQRFFKIKMGKLGVMSGNAPRNNGAIVFGAVVLGLLLLKSIFDRNAQGYRCPVCSLFLQKDTQYCPRCHTELNWQGVS